MTSSNLEETLALAKLRRRAERRLKHIPPQIESTNETDVLKLLHELQVYRVELEMQNEELVAARAEIEMSAARYTELYDFAPVSYYTLDEDGNIFESNLAGATLLGILRGQRPHPRFRTFIDPELRSQFDGFLAKVFKSSFKEVHETVLQTHDKSKLYVHIEATSSENNEACHLVVIDISARRQAEEALRQSEETFHTLADNISQLAWMADQNGNIVWYNQRWFHYTGTTLTEMQQSGWEKLHHPQHKQCVMEKFTYCLTHGEPWEDTFPLCSKDSTYRWFLSRAIPIYNEHGRISRWFGTHTDITEQKELEQALNITNTELDRSRQIAEKATQAKSEFLSNMSHELRTPLNAILGFAQLMQSSSPPPTTVQGNRLNEILKAGWHLLELINEILDLTRIESGKLALTKESISLAMVMRECRALVEVQAHQQGIKMSFPALADRVLVQGDRMRLKQVLLNLFSNAIKYNRPGGTVEIKCSSSNSKYVRISVHDSGIGMTPDNIAQLFQPFNRLGRERAAVEGTGIGLVITKRLVEMMGGTIGVESTAGVGSVFWVELLAAMERQERTLLYVEDNQANLALVEQLFADRTQWRLLCAMNAHRGIELACAEKPSVIIMDINLAGMNGIEALKILRADPLTAHIPVIALSSDAAPHQIEQGLAAGFFRYVTKPLRVAELMDAIEDALKL
ncbi:MAG: ATP-binding protein [Pseudomonadota bacterium]